MAEKVRYQVLQKVFVNGSLIDPKGRKDVFVHAAPGLEGTALKLAPEKPAKAKAANGGSQSGDAGTSGGGDAQNATDS